MEKPTAATLADFEKAIPADARAVRGQMFGQPAVFVNGNMFLGTFGQSIVARVGEARAATLAGAELRVFEPMGKTWKEYLQAFPGTLPAATLASLGADALAFTAGLPAKPEKKKAAKKSG